MASAKDLIETGDTLIDRQKSDEASEMDAMNTSEPSLQSLGKAYDPEGLLPTYHRTVSAFFKETPTSSTTMTTGDAGYKPPAPQ
jgi:hypothetical protein